MRRLGFWTAELDELRVESGNRPLLAVPRLGADQLAVRDAPAQRIDIGESAHHDIGAPPPGGRAAKPALRVLAVMVDRLRQETDFFADCPHDVADLGHFGIVVLVLHPEGCGYRVDWDASEPDAEIALEPLVQRLQLPNELLDAGYGREVRQPFYPGDRQLLFDQCLFQPGGEAIGDEREPFGGNECRAYPLHDRM